MTCPNSAPVVSPCGGSVSSCGGSNPGVLLPCVDIGKLLDDEKASQNEAVQRAKKAKLSPEMIAKIEQLFELYGTDGTMSAEQLAVVQTQLNNPSLTTFDPTTLAAFQNLLSS